MDIQQNDKIMGDTKILIEIEYDCDKWEQ